MKDDVNKRLCELLDAEPKELTQSRDEWERLTLKAKAGFEGLLADYLDAAAGAYREIDLVVTRTRHHHIGGGE